jgi:periplasmic protein TonB
MFLRQLLFAGPALLVTAGLFILMTSILHHDDYQADDQSKILFADFLMPKRKIETMRQIEKPDKPEFKAEPQLQLPEVALLNNQPSVSKIPSFKLPRMEANVKINMSLPQSSGDSDYMPVLKVAPLYPPRAEKRRQEGYVLVEFTVTRSGEVRDVKVIESKPRYVFDRAAIEAARKFKYKPRKVDGEPVEVSGVQNKFLFRLER